MDVNEEEIEEFENIFKDHRFHYYEKFAIKKELEELRRYESKKANDILYGINDTPPIHMAIFLGIQHYITMFGSTMAVPIILAPYLCIEHDTEALTNLISTIFFISGVATLIQVTIGCRLPIIQGATFAYIQPSIQILTSQKFKCAPASLPTNNSNTTSVNDWRNGMQEIQGAIIVASIFQLIIGLTGIIGLLTRFVGPITIATTISLIGISLVESVGNFASDNWGFAFFNVCCITGFSQLPKKRSLLKIFPVFISLIFCSCIWVSFEKLGYQMSSRKQSFGLSLIKKAHWFKIPYPGQWGQPTFSVSSTLAITIGVIVSVIESIGNYIACAEVTGVSRPPRHAINRGIAVEGLTSILAGIWGSGCGTTSYSENIAAIGVTKVASRSVIQIGATAMIGLSLFGKFGSLFLLIPRSIIGGMFWMLFSSILSVGISALQKVDLNSKRNMFVIGFSLYSGMVIPNWTRKNLGSVYTDYNWVNEALHITLSSNMFIGTITAFLLDNIFPNNDSSAIVKIENSKHYKTFESYSSLRSNIKDNLLLLFTKKVKHTHLSKLINSEISELDCLYDLPLLLQTRLNKLHLIRYIPFLPYHTSSEINDV